MKKPIEHGFTWYNIVWLIFWVLVIVGIHYGMIVIPQVRQTANQVANLNDLKIVNLKCDVHLLAGKLSCSGTL